MALIVQKFGGTSVGSIERIRNVAWRVAKWQSAGHRIVVVPSAMSGETNRLLTLAAGLQEHPDPRELDVVASTGEQVTVGLLAMALLALGVKARSYAGWQVKVLTDSANGAGRYPGSPAWVMSRVPARASPVKVIRPRRPQIQRPAP